MLLFASNVENVLAEFLTTFFYLPFVRFIEWGCAVLYLYLALKTAVWFIAPLWNSEGNAPDDLQNAFLFLKGSLVHKIMKSRPSIFFQYQHSEPLAKKSEGKAEGINTNNKKNN